MDIKDLTAAGWLLLLATIIGALGLGIPTLVLLDQNLPPGRYPKLLFMIPTVVIGLAIFFGGARLLRAMGKTVKRPPTTP
jgi:hypothetical protein